MQLANIGKLLEIVKPVLGNHGIEVGVTLIGNDPTVDDYGVTVSGFYKHGNITLNLIEENGQPVMIITGRYGKMDEFYNPSFEDIARRNFYEYLNYKDGGFVLNDYWVPFLLELGLIKAKTTYEAA